MKEVFFKHRYHSQILELQQQLYNAGFIASYGDVVCAWQRHSDDLDAQWLSVSARKEDNVANILYYLEEKEE
jgi:hypothetical protein